MDEKILAKEKEYLTKTIAVLQQNLQGVEQERTRLAQALPEQRRHIWENLADMDSYEQSGAETEAQLGAEHYVMLTRRRTMMTAQLANPYFGKIDFGATPDKRFNFYIGLAQVEDASGSTYVVDWRAPVAELYYNCDLGDAQYQAPMGIVRGKVYAKYQFKIENGQLQYMVDTATTILDEVLLRELGKNASPVMHNIAATIQREQNAIIRYGYSDNVLVLGVAGSGKTSIALHRIAYILYHSRSTLRAGDMLIVTPNKAFTAYIANVLPELGEEMVAQYSMDDFAAIELKAYGYQSRAEHLEQLYGYERPSAERQASMRYKASTAFVGDIERFAARVDELCFHPRDFVAGAYTCDKQTFSVLYHKRFAHYPALVRMRKIVDYVVREMGATFHSKLSQTLVERITGMIMQMYTRYDVVSLYRRMLKTLVQRGAPVLLYDKESVIPYEDVNGVILLKTLVEGSDVKTAKIKHLVVDEMQDYTPVQYAYLNRLFTCPKTVLGDVNQTVDPYLNVGDADTARALLGGDQCAVFALHTSYRSSYEIATYANRFTPNAITPIDRHEEQPMVMACTEENWAQTIGEQIEEARRRGLQSVGIITRTDDEATFLRRALARYQVQYLHDGKTPYAGGVVVSTPFVVKGFEFDQVILANANAQNYGTDNDKLLLYIGATRALHRLCVLYVGRPSPYLGV